MSYTGIKISQDGKTKEYLDKEGKKVFLPTQVSSSDVNNSIQESEAKAISQQKIDIAYNSISWDTGKIAEFNRRYDVVYGPTGNASDLNVRALSLTINSLAHQKLAMDGPQIKALYTRLNSTK
jgi:hypothetical protein